MSNDKAARLRFQERGAEIVKAAQQGTKVPPMASLIDFVDDKTKMNLTAALLGQLKEKLSAVLNLPGVGKLGSVNKRIADKLVAEIAECRKILGPINVEVN